MNTSESLIFIGVFLAFSATSLLMSIAGWRWVLAGHADYQRKRKFLLMIWAVASSYLLVKLGMDWLEGEKVTVMSLMGGLMGTAWAFVLLFWGQRIAARALGFQLPR
jgi:hypothetical protein